MDDFIVAREKRYNTGHEEWVEYDSLQWDAEWLSDHFFKKLKNSAELLLPSYDYITDTQKWRSSKIPETCLIIIEGVFLQREEWRPFFDYMIYLDCSRESRFSRESKSTQENIAIFRNRYWKAEEFYIKNINPLAQADLILHNEGKNQGSIEGDDTII